jgi:hypothetical protein
VVAVEPVESRARPSRYLEPGEVPQ